MSVILIKGVNDLATMRPDIAKELDVEKSGFRADEVTYGSGKKGWWKCPNGHLYQSYVFNRTRKEKFSGCPYCSGRIPIKGVSDLATMRPDIAKELDVEKSGFRADEVTYGSGKKAWWICPERHSYIASIDHRTREKDPTSCPYCAGQLPVKGETDLATLYPDVAKELDVEKSRFGPDEVTSGSGKKGWWTCNAGHSYMAKICDRTREERPSDCPYCSGRLVIEGETDLMTVYPEVAAELDVKMSGFRASEVASSSNKIGWWTCNRGHSYAARISNRTRSNNPTGCPYCDGKLPIQGETDLATMFPAIAKELDVRKSGFRADEVTGRSGKKAWWICDRGHSYQAEIIHRTRKNKSSGCPYCSGRLPIKGETDLATVYPETIRNWDYEHNPNGPESVVAHSMKKIWWKCKKCNEHYRRSPAKEVKAMGCPRCS